MILALNVTLTTFAITLTLTGTEVLSQRYLKSNRQTSIELPYQQLYFLTYTK